jgi:hypothetical protein
VPAALDRALLGGPSTSPLGRRDSLEVAVRPDKTTSALILGGACIALYVAYCFLEPTTPLWVRGALLVVTVALFPLLNSLGIFEGLGLKRLPGLQLRPRWMFAGVPLFAAGCVWAFIGARLAPDTTAGVILVVGPSLGLMFAALFCFFKGAL